MKKSKLFDYWVETGKDFLGVLEAIYFQKPMEKLYCDFFDRSPTGTCELTSKPCDFQGIFPGSHVKPYYGVCDRKLNSNRKKKEV